MSEKQRRFGRVPVNLHAGIYVGEDHHKAIASNISVGGVFLAISEAVVLKIGEKYKVEVQLHQPSQRIQTTAEVRWRGTEPVHGYGFAFDDLTPLDAWALLQQGRSPAEAIQYPHPQKEFDRELD